MQLPLTFADTLDEIGKAILSFNSISDVLDVLLVAFVIYSAIKLIRETRAIQLAKGFVLLAVIYAAVYLLHMQVSTYMFSMVFSNLLLVLVIVFSPEIRHALESVGRSSVSNFNFFGFKNSEDIRRQEEQVKMINAVTKACADMSDKKIGALMVFEKESILGEIIHTGTPVDAEISAELIGNIFYPKAPLHDGAAVIRDARVAAAGCILPLTQNNNNVSSELGTRHRAAIGISEQTDALVVVVSEETGAISVAQKGNLRRGLSSGDLRELLLQNFTKPEPDEDNKLKKLLKGRQKHEEKY
ncbi:MAG: diadenylate cyclase CdaA [Candidatus Fimenecus sp.]